MSDWGPDDIEAAIDWNKAYIRAKHREDLLMMAACLLILASMGLLVAWVAVMAFTT